MLHPRINRHLLFAWWWCCWRTFLIFASCEERFFYSHEGVIKNNGRTENSQIKASVGNAKNGSFLLYLVAIHSNNISFNLKRCLLLLLLSIHMNQILKSLSATKIQIRKKRSNIMVPYWPTIALISTLYYPCP